MSHAPITKPLTTMSLHTISVILFVNGLRNIVLAAKAQRPGEAITTDHMSSYSTIRVPSLSLTHAGPTNAPAIPDGRQFPVDDSDEALVGRIATCDRDSLKHLFRRYAPNVYSIGRRILRDEAEAEDLVQEVFLYIFKKSSGYDPSKGRARSWLFQVAYTQAFLRRRQLRSHGFYTSEIANRPLEPNLQVSSGSHYDHSVEGLFGRNGWKKIVEDLTEDQRETFRLHFFEGYTFPEIAEKLGQSYANVRNHYYRGLEKLRKHLAEDQLNKR
jgi:RNA polymerase sigma-70 factor, ECF subfamily